jgi:hypothetical protein
MNPEQIRDELKAEGERQGKEILDTIPDMLTSHHQCFLLGWVKCLEYLTRPEVTGDSEPPFEWDLTDNNN